MKQYKLVLMGIATLLLVAASPARVYAAEPVNVELIIDASGSMAARMEGKTKMDIAKDVLMGLVTDLSGDAQVAVHAYGHNRKEDCDDIELLVPLGPQEPSRFAEKVKALKPVGMTPIAGALEAAERNFSGREGQHNLIILVSDGKETCKRDPCAVAKRLRQSGVQVEINVIGFNVTPEERKQLECIAEEGGGKYYNAANAKEFQVAAAEVKQQVAQAQPPAEPAKPPAQPKAANLLAATNGGQVLVAPSDDWLQTIDGKENGVQLYPLEGQESVFAFKDEQPATFDTFTMLIPGAGNNLREFELLVGNDSPTGEFRSVGKFQAQNAKLLKSPYQEFKFSPVTAKYLKVKLLSSYGEGFLRAYVQLYEFQVLGQLQEGTTAAAQSSKSASAQPKAINLLAATNGGQVLVAPSDDWLQTIDGKENGVQLYPLEGQESVFAFKDEQPATFDTFTMLIPGAGNNLREFELLVGNDSPTGEFRSVGKFQAQNAKLLKSPYQEFKFSPVTAKYLKVKLLSSYGEGFLRAYVQLYEFQVLGQLQGGTAQ